MKYISFLLSLSFTTHNINQTTKKSFAHWISLENVIFCKVSTVGCTLHGTSGKEFLLIVGVCFKYISTYYQNLIKGFVLSLLCLLQLQNKSFLQLPLWVESISLTSKWVLSGSDRMDRKRKTRLKPELGRSCEQGRLSFHLFAFFILICEV